MASAIESVFSALPGALASGGDVAGVFTALGRSQIGRVEVRSQFSPPVVVDDPLAPSSGPPQPPPWYLRLLKPEIRVYAPDGSLTMAVAPAGPPTENYVPYLVGGTLIFVLGAWVAGSLLLRRVLK